MSPLQLGAPRHTLTPDAVLAIVRALQQVTALGGEPSRHQPAHAEPGERIGDQAALAEIDQQAQLSGSPRALASTVARTLPTTRPSPGNCS